LTKNFLFVTIFKIARTVQDLRGALFFDNIPHLEEPLKMTRPKISDRVDAKSSSEFEVPIEVMSWLKEDFGQKSPGSLAFRETVANGMTIMDLIRHLGGKFPIFGKKAFGQKEDMTEYCMVILSGRIISSVELSQELKPGDKITLTPAFYGG
jgi:molybdopterin converting factor small subunit